MESLHETCMREKIEVSMAVCGVCVLSQVTEIHAVTGDWILQGLVDHPVFLLQKSSMVDFVQC